MKGAFPMWEFRQDKKRQTKEMMEHIDGIKENLKSIEEEPLISNEEAARIIEKKLNDRGYHVKDIKNIEADIKAIRERKEK